MPDTLLETRELVRKEKGTVEKESPLKGLMG